MFSSICNGLVVRFVALRYPHDAVATVVSNNSNNLEPSAVSQTPLTRDEGAAPEDITSSSTNKPTTMPPSSIDTTESRTVLPNKRMERPVSKENDMETRTATEVTRRRKRVVEERSAETENIVTSTDIPADIKRVLENVSEFSAVRDKEQQNANRSPTSATTSSAASDTSDPQPVRNEDDDDDEKDKEEPSLEEYWVRYRDAYNSKCSVPLQTVLQLGYTTQEIRSLQADALDLIVTDGIPKPTNGGVPLHWQIKADADREVRVGRPRPKPNTDNNAAAEPSSQRRERSDFGSDRREGRRRTRSSVPQPREDRDESMWFDNDSEDPSRNKFWMDLPEFRDYLKREAELRLRILGPDWRDWIKTESDWRYALYKDWLWLLEDGVGEPIVGEPKPSRRTNNSKPRPRPPSSSVGDPNTERRRERTRPRQSDSTGNDIRMDDSRPQPQRRTERRQRNLDRDSDDDDDDDTENTASRQTRRRNRDTDESSSSEPIRRTRRRPPRPQRSIDDDDNVEDK
eukprot:scaffold35416_cov51-Attheya_sp.AAC.1